MNEDKKIAELEIDEETKKRVINRVESICARMTDEKIKEMAIGIYNNTIFTELQIHPSHRQSTGMLIFMPFLFDKDLHLVIEELEARNEVGIMYGPLSSSTARACNGYPTLTVCGLLSLTNTKAVLDKYNEIIAKINDL